MEKPVQFESIQPRFLRYRSHYKIFFIILLTLSGIVLSFWGHQLSQQRWQEVYSEYSYEFWLSSCYFLVFGSFYTFWLRFRLNHSVQVYSSHVLIHNLKKVEEIKFEDIESVAMVCWSVFYFKMKNGDKFYFSSSLERVDYIWEGFYTARPDLLSQADFEAFRTKLVQYDHHQKRKEWFFRHKLVDVFNWVVMPFAFLIVSYAIQSREVVINQQGMYFFRLLMYSLLVLLVTTFLYSIVLKKFIFDKRIKLQMNSQPDDKLRDLEFEGVILHRSKMMQMITAAFIFGLVLHTEINLFSLTKVKEDVAGFQLKSGKTLVVDNRFNCVGCKYPIKDGDIVVFGKGTVGQIMALQGDMVGQFSQDKTGRVIASESVQDVPHGYVAIKLANQRDMVMVKISDLIGKIKK